MAVRPHLKALVVDVVKEHLLRGPYRRIRDVPGVEIVTIRDVEGLPFMLITVQTANETFTYEIKISQKRRT